MTAVINPALEAMAKAMCEHISGYYNQQYINQAKAALRALEEAGWVVLPMQPTEEIIQKVLLEISDNVYIQMLEQGGFKTIKFDAPAKLAYQAAIEARPRIVCGE